MFTKLNSLLRDDQMFEKLEKLSNFEQIKDNEVRHVSVLFADISGFTAMSEKVNHETVQYLCDELMFSFSQRIEKYGGYVDKYEGDRIVAHFGSKKFLEENTRRAVYSGLEIIDVINRFNLKKQELSELRDIHEKLAVRVGINSGMVTAGKVGNKREGDFTIYGDVANLASRMEENGVINRVMVPESVAKEISDYFLFSFNDEIMVKGKTKPISTWLVEKIKHLQVGRVVSQNAFLGRKKELKQLLDIYYKNCKEIKQLETISKIDVLGVMATAGFGKTRLINEFFAQLDKKVVLQALISPIYQPPFSAFISLLRNYFGIQIDSSFSYVKKRFHRKISELKKTLPAEFANQLMVIQPFLMFLLGYKTAEGQLSTGREELLSSINFALLVFIQAITYSAKTLNSPLVVFFDDIHWVDEASFSAINYIIKNFSKIGIILNDQNLKILIILAYREGFIPSSVIYHQSDFQQINLGELQSYDINHMLTNLMAEIHITDEIKQLLAKYSAGNPFYLEQWSKLIKMKYKNNNNYKISISEIPNSINSLILSRINNFDSRAQKILQKAAVIGTSFYRNILEHLEMKLENMTNLDNTFNQFIDANLMTIEKLENDKYYTFQHQLIRDAIYGMVIQSNRKILSKLIAQIIEEDYSANLEEFYFQLADHYEVAQMPKRCCIYLEKSEQLAKSLFMNRKALMYNAKLIDMADLKLKNEILLRRCELLHRIGEYTKASDALKQIKIWEIKSENLLDTYILLRAMLYFAMGKTSRGSEFLVSKFKKLHSKEKKIEANILLMDMRRNNKEDKSFLDDAHSLLRNLNQYSFYKARLLNIIGLYYYSLSKYKKALSFYQLSLETDKSNKNLNRKVTHNIATIYDKFGDKTKAIDFYHKALSLARLTDDVEGSGKVLSDLSTIYMKQEKFEKALSMQEESLEIAQVTGNFKLQGLVIYNIANNYYCQEKLSQARKFLGESINICTKISDYSGLCFANDLLGDILFTENMLAEAKTIYLQNLEIQKKLGDREGIAHTYGNIGNIVAEKGNLDSAEKFYKSQLEILIEIGDIEGQAKAYFNLGTIYEERKNYLESIKIVSIALKLFKKVDAKIYIDTVEDFLKSLYDK